MIIYACSEVFDPVNVHLIVCFFVGTHDDLQFTSSFVLFDMGWQRQS